MAFNEKTVTITPYRANPSIASNQAVKSMRASLFRYNNTAGIWKDLCAEFDSKRKEIEDYKESKLNECDTYVNPELEYLNNTVFPTLNESLIKMLEKAIEEDSLTMPKTTFDGMDFLSECLWNSNPNHPERKLSWTYIFDMDWAEKILQNKPRPYYPFSRVWSQDYAALKIQSYMRGYWVRRRDNVQEVRQFWKIIDGRNPFRKTPQYIY